MENIEKDLWERQENESTQAYEAFAIYRDMGKKRSASKVAKHLGKSLALMDRWMSKWKWRVRVQAYEDHLEKVALNARDKVVAEMLERHTKVSMMFQSMVIQGLQQVKDQQLTPLELIKIFESSVNIERKSRGVADVVDEVRLQQAQQKLDIEKARVGNSDKLQEGSGFIDGIMNLGANVWAEGESSENADSSPSKDGEKE